MARENQKVGASSREGHSMSEPYVPLPPNLARITIRCRRVARSAALFSRACRSGVPLYGARHRTTAVRSAAMITPR